MTKQAQLADPKDFFRQRRAAKARGETIDSPSNQKPPRKNRAVPRFPLANDDRRHAEDFRLITWSMFIQAIRLGADHEQFPQEHRAAVKRQCMLLAERIKAMHGVEL